MACESRVLAFSAWLMLGPTVAASAQPADKEAPKAKTMRDVDLSFQSRPDIRNRVELTGPDAADWVKFEPAGARITMSERKEKQIPEIGLRFPIEIKGDFELTMTYEIVAEPTPEDTGFGSRLTLGVRLDTPGNDVARISRQMHAKGVKTYATWASEPRDEAFKEKARIRYFPAQANTGRLRLARQGAEFSYFACDGDNPDFKFLHKFWLGDEPVKIIHIVAHTGGPKATIDFRVTDLRLRAEGEPDEPAPVAAPRPKWLLITIILGLMVAFFMMTVLGVLLLVRRAAAKSKEADD